MSCAVEWFSAADLMAMEFASESVTEYRSWLLELIDSGECHPLCIFADPGRDAACSCPCEGLHHGAIREVRI